MAIQLQTGLGVQLSAMAIQLQTGLGVSTGTEHVLLMMQNNELSDISRELKALLKGLQSAQDDVDAIAAQVCRLEMKQCQLASSRQITDLNDGADGNATSLAAQADALGFGYMWSKGLSFMEQVSYALAAARKHLTQRIENLGGEVEQQMEVSKFIRSDVRYEPVNGVHDNLSQLGYDVDSLNQMVSGMNGKIMTSDEKQGVKEFADNLFPEDGSVGSDNQPRRLTRYSRRVTRRNTVKYSC